METNNVKFSGIISALASCIDAQENVNEDSIRQFMRWQLMHPPL